METLSSVCLCFWNWRQDWLLWLFSIISPSRLDGRHSWQHWEEKEMFKGRGGSQKLPLTRALSIHVLHLICTKGITGGAKSKALVDEVLYLLWCPHLSLQPSLSSPRLSSALWFLSFFCVLKELTVLLSLGVLRVCEPHCSLPLSVMRKAWKNNVWGQNQTPLMSVSSLLILCSCFSRRQRRSSQTSNRCAPFDTLHCKTHNYVCKTHNYVCTDAWNQKAFIFARVCLP